MSKFMIGDRVQINGEPTDWNIGTIKNDKYRKNQVEVRWDVGGILNIQEEGALYLVHRPLDALASISGDNLPDTGFAAVTTVKLMPAEPPFAEQVDTILNSVGTLLKQKNEAYGDSALNPVRIFSKADPADGLRVRIDDKLSRIARGTDAGEDTVTDLLGYLVMLKISEGNK